MTLCLRCFLTHFLVLVSGLVCTISLVHREQLTQISTPLEAPQRTILRATLHSPLQDDSTIALQPLHDLEIYIVLALSLLLLIAFSLSLTRTMLKPLKTIEQVATQFSAGDLNSRIPLSEIPEIRKLELILNHAADRVQGMEERCRAFISDFSHEISTPLTVIQGYLELIDTSALELTPEIKHELYEEAERMNRLLTDLNRFTIFETGELLLYLETFCPIRAIRQVIANFNAKGWANQCQLHWLEAETLPAIFADRDHFKQILTNIISNGLNYTPQGIVTVRAWAEQDKLWIRVQDTGIGIAEEDLPFVFQRFWRSEQSRQLREDGSGIGLAITEKLINIMGGQITVESQLGQGTTFRFCLPISKSG